MDLSVLRRSLQFKYSTLEKATAYFDDHHKLGRGGFGEVFKVNVSKLQFILSVLWPISTGNLSIFLF